MIARHADADAMPLDAAAYVTTLRERAATRGERDIIMMR